MKAVLLLGMPMKINHVLNPFVFGQVGNELLYFDGLGS